MENADAEKAIAPENLRAMDYHHWLRYRLPGVCPSNSQDLLEEPNIETPEPEAEPDNPTGLQTPVVDISTATTTENVEIPPEELALLLKPMTIGKITGRYIKIYSF